MLVCHDFIGETFSRVRFTAFIAASLIIFSTSAVAAPTLDCPLRDKPFSLQTPFLDVLLSPSAKGLVQQHMPDLLITAPPIFLETKAPAFGAIVSIGVVANMLKQPKSAVAKLERSLMRLPVSDSDRAARCARYDNIKPDFDFSGNGKRLLVFEKINGFDHGPSVTAATNAIKVLAEQQGWQVSVTDKGGAFTPDILRQFDAVIWNNNSGDVLTLSQRQAFEDYIHQGGGYVGIHGAGGDASYYWDWYVSKLLGAQFIGHPMEPQFQTATVQTEMTGSRIAEDLHPGWSMMDEWYSFGSSPRLEGADIVATLDESSYSPGHAFGQDLQMGDDHPIAWTRCLQQGRAFYTAIGHRSEVYHIPENLILLREGIIWAMGDGATQCAASQSLPRS